MRYMVAANMLGIPAISVPVGLASDPSSGDVAAAMARHSGSAATAACELPVGLQIMAQPWQEALLFRVAAALEAAVHVKRPSLHWDLLKVEN